MTASHKILKVCNCTTRSRRLEAFIFDCIWDKYDTPQPVLLSPPQSFSSSKWSTESILGYVCYRCFAMKMLCYEKWALSKSTGCDEDTGECQTCPQAALTPFNLWRAPSSPVSKYIQTCSRCVASWMAPQHTDSWLSYVQDRQGCSCSMERLIDMLGCWSWGHHNLHYYFWRAQFLLDFWFDSQTGI